MQAYERTHINLNRCTKLYVCQGQLFIADDVGLGKTIEAGLIARELLLRRRVDRIVVACPPSMLEQWRDEMESRFGLFFVILDRDYFTRMRRERGFSVNPGLPTPGSWYRIVYSSMKTYASGLRDWIGQFCPLFVTYSGRGA